MAKSKSQLTFDKISRAKAKHPDQSVAEIAKRLKLSPSLYYNVKRQQEGETAPTATKRKRIIKRTAKMPQLKAAQTRRKNAKALGADPISTPSKIERVTLTAPNGGDNIMMFVGSPDQVFAVAQKLGG